MPVGNCTPLLGNLTWERESGREICGIECGVPCLGWNAPLDIGGEAEGVPPRC